MVTREETLLLILVPAGILLLLWDDQTGKTGNPTGSSKGKEDQYLRYNKDEIFKNLIATEGHFRNVSDRVIDTEGYMNCAVKHLADAEQHADEAISHSLIVESPKQSEHFKKLAGDIKNLRHAVQENKIKGSEGIEKVRQIRRSFEGFNPEFDINKCEGCIIHD